MIKWHVKYFLQVGFGLLCLLGLFTIAVAADEQPQPSTEIAVQAVTTQEAKNVQAAKQALAGLKQRNQLIKEEYDDLQKQMTDHYNKLTPLDITKRALDKSMLDTALARANFDGAEVTLAEAQQQLDTTSGRIRILDAELRNTTLAAGKTEQVTQRIGKLQEQLNNQRELLKVQQQYADLAHEFRDLTKKIYSMQRDISTQISALKQTKQQLDRQQQLNEKEQQLVEQQNFWHEQINNLYEEISQLDPMDPTYSKQREKLRFLIFESQERSNTLHVEIVLARLYNQVSSLPERTDEDQSFNTLNGEMTRANILLDEIKQLKILIGRKIELFQRRLALDLQCLDNCIISTQDFEESKALFKQLLTTYEQAQGNINDLETRVKDYQAAIQKELNRALSRRQGLPGFSIKAWFSLGDKLLQLPGLALPVLKALARQMQVSMLQMTGWSFVGILALQGLLLGMWLYLRGFFDRLAQRLAKNRQSIAANLVYVLIELVHRHLTTIYLFAALVTLFAMGGGTLTPYLPIIYLLLVWFVFKLAICLARLALLESTTDVTGRDVKLYNNLWWTLWVGGIVTMLTVIAYQLPVDYQISDFFNRLFMLFLFVIGFILLRGWRIVPTLLEPFVDGARPYFMRVVRLLSLLLPLTVLSVSLIGLSGYVDLAWAISKYEGIFLLVLSSYVIVRGFYNDFMEWISELFIRRLRNGWLWTQAILRPLDKILRLALIIATIAALFIAYGWGKDSYVVTKLQELSRLNLLPLQETEINLIGVVQFIIAGAVLFWVARWTREFAYRWLFAKTKDLGLRNSLAAFTQYITVFAGILIALNVIGIDLTLIKWVVTALAFGIGFGLRDLAKNYVSGMLLLIERPVRVGDLVTISDYQGEITHIGMRAITVKTWDHMEVLVPNCEAFDKSFTNWTHFDSIVRTVVDVRVKYSEDPVAIQALILRILEQSTYVVIDPEPQVFLKEIGNTLLEFEVRYFINLKLGHPRAKVRSIILFEIAAAFKEMGIETPNSQQDLYIRSLPQPIA